MKRAYTLSEVLITLGIIGVVAAITLSTAIGKFQNFVLRKQFVKSYNKLYQAIEKSYVDLGYISKCSYSTGAGFNTTEAGCREFQTTLKKNLNIIKQCSRTSESCSDLNNKYTPMINSNYDYILTLSDGTVLFFYSNFVGTPIYAIDVNGLRGPNKNGFDIHYFWIENNKLKCYGDFGTGQNSIKCSKMLEHPY